MKALILVGGYGTRLRPLTLTTPKPTVEFCNKAMIIYQIEALVKVGVTEVVFAIAYKPELLSECMKKYEKDIKIKFSYSQEMEPLGTAGPIALARSILDDGQPFFVLNSDIICTFPLEDLLKFHNSHGKEGSIMITKVEDPSKYGVVVTESEGKIVSFVEKPKNFVSNRINAGIYLFNPSIFERIQAKPTSIEKEIFPKMAEQMQLYAFDLPGFWMDIGQPKDFQTGVSLYLNHLRQIAPQQLRNDSDVIGNVLVDETAKIGKGCVLGPNVTIGKNCTIEDGVRITDTTVLEGVIIRANSLVKSSIIGWHSTIGKWARIENMCVLGQDVQVDNEIHINGGKVLPHKSISENVREPAIIM
jgi:mannose-1-phosphate guanylyltransferase